MFFAKELSAVFANLIIYVLKALYKNLFYSVDGCGHFVKDTTAAENQKMQPACAGRLQAQEIPLSCHIRSAHRENIAMCHDEVR